MTVPARMLNLWLFFSAKLIHAVQTINIGGYITWEGLTFFGTFEGLRTLNTFTFTTTAR